MPLSLGHHRYLPDAIHVNATLFVELYGSESELVEKPARIYGIIAKHLWVRPETDDAVLSWVEDTQEQALNQENTMYFALEPALMRIFGTPELMIKTASWQRDINAGYRKTTVASEHRSTRDERLGDDGIRKGELRERMQPELFAILTIRYDDNQANRSDAWLRVNHIFRADERVPKAIRKNPVLVRLYLMAALQLPELKNKRGKITITGKSRTTLFRWDKACATVADEWSRKAEDQACELLESADVIAYDNIQLI